MRAVILHKSTPTRSLLKLLAIVTLTTAAAAPLHSQVLHGQVVDSVNAEPLGSLEVVLLDAQRDTVAVARSGNDGRFALRAPEGEYTLCVRCIGHRPKQMAVEVPSEAPIVVRLAQINIAQNS
jgi:hypothetical protein